jgi:2-keto-4-pentenoate hydratase/2-oxohepta-3-ene-1,7-dioic acid hydratase in catechol pathway
MAIGNTRARNDFGLATLEIVGAASAAIWIDGHYWPLEHTTLFEPGVDVAGLLDNWLVNFAKLSKYANACASGETPAELAVTAESAKLLAPLRFPKKILGVAFNYGGQFLELGLPPVPWKPLPFFVRPASNTLIGPGEPLHMPRGESLDWEIEIGAVMGRRMRNVPAAEGLKGVAAYTVAVDLTVRDLIAVDNPFKTDLFRSKCQDGLSPMGPVIMPAEFVPDPHNLRLQLSINDHSMQDARSSDMLVPIGELISEASRYITWEPGDILLTGTPAGTSGKSGKFLKPGDRVRAEIEALGAFEFEILPRLSSNAS